MVDFIEKIASATPPNMPMLGLASIDAVVFRGRYRCPMKADLTQGSGISYFGLSSAAVLLVVVARCAIKALAWVIM